MLIPDSAKGAVVDDMSGHGAKASASGRADRLIALLQEECRAVRGTTMDIPSVRMVESFVDAYGESDARRIVKWLFTEHYRGEFPMKGSPLVVSTNFMRKDFSWLAEAAKQESYQHESKVVSVRSRTSLKSLMDVVKATA